ncbi:DUF5684 domain-containing protein [Paenibacillus sp. M1]|uniref:DUF5684 domain-containing protein n=1 Tax=Paenibacillus haidiansis TaxID=1574488 RepID=A0ABU7VSN5_9BACL
MLWFAFLLALALYFLYAGAFFSLAKKAGLDHIAWFAFIPILSSILQLRMIQKSGWWVLMYFVPIASFVFAIIWQVQLLNAFGKNGAFVIFNILLAPVYMILWMVWGYSSETTYQLGNPIPPNGVAY